jgi:hypothetical protein
MTDLTGSCICNHTTFRITSQIGPLAVCHCSACHKAVNGAAFFVSKPQLQITSGEDTLREYTRQGDSTQSVKMYFCSQCPTVIYQEPEILAPNLILNAATIDDQGYVRGLEPMREIYCKGRYGWVEEAKGEGCLRFEGAPTA